MSKSATILGVLLGTIVLLLNMVDFSQGKILSAFFNWQGFLVVIGGTLSAVLVNYPLNQFACIFQSIGKVFSSEPVSNEEAIEQVIYYSHIAHKKGVLALEKELDFIDDEFLKMGISNLLIYHDSTLFRTSLENKLNSMRLRHMTCQDVFNNMASYAPAFGMLGTVMGLIIMMTSQVAGADAIPVDGESNDMLAALLQGMGLALVTTFYGVLFSNFMFIPIAGKLKVLSDLEAQKNEILIEGLMGIRREEGPLMIREILFGYVNEKTKQKLEQSVY